MMRKQFITSIASLCILICTGQTKEQSWPQIGKPFANFVLDSVDNYSKKTISYADFKNKWIILEFWGENCSGCIGNFPRLNELQKKFRDKIQFILCTQTYKDPRTAMALFDKLKDKLNLTMPVSFDQNFVQQVGPDGLPTAIIINPRGNVDAITHNITEDDIRELLSGEEPKLDRAYLSYETKPSDAYKRTIPLLINGNGGSETSYLYRSVLTKWNPQMPTFNVFIHRNGLEIFRIDLKRLYLLAYFGKYSWAVQDTPYYGNYYSKPILEIRDSGLFHSDVFANENIFCYSLSFSEDILTGPELNPYILADKPRLQKIMQRDLENCFGFSVRIESRKMKYLSLVATKDALEEVKTKGGKKVFASFQSNNGIKGTNIPVSFLIATIIESSGFPSEMQIMDETGIRGNIDIQIDALYFNEWLTQLSKKGISLIVKEKEMKVLVIGEEDYSN